MCGIGGIALRAGRVVNNLGGRLQAMRAAMAHRGPDDQGLYLTPDGRTGLVSCRLAIRDLSPAGHMPMSDADGATWITYNGEIYNADALRPQLEHGGWRFRSSSDTEVLLASYAAYGSAMFTQLRGMFAFGLYDAGAAAGRLGQPRLLLARDQLGVKPLYYAHTPDGLVFASELKAIIASGLVSRTIDPAALVAYLLLGSVPCPLTIYRDVRCLEPGCSLSLAVGDAAQQLEIRRYWELPCPSEEAGDPSEVAAYVRGLLADAVRSQLVSDVPLGAFLSGGLDSSSVVALMRAATSGPIRTCSMVFSEQGYSEASYAQAVATAVGAEHHERVISSADVLGSLDRIFWAMDQPSIDGVNSYFVAETARQAGLTVALSGLGGDELFGGYQKTFGGVPRTLRSLRLAQRVPGGAALAATAMSVLPVGQRWGKVVAALGRPASHASAYLVQRGLFTPPEARALVGPEIWVAAQSCDPVRLIAERADTTCSAEAFGWVSRAELRTYTHHQLLRDTDVMSMAHSLEVRVPLLDHVLVEALLRLPAAAKGGVGPKPLLLRAVGDLLPAVVRERRDKQGFTFPFDRWLRGTLRPTLDTWRAAGPGLLRPNALADAQRSFDAGRLHWSRLWAIAALEGWAAQGMEH